ncbi:MAG: hypothetical protein H0X39_06235 [Actinobacteria bacterium]|nr:hypothetical protein [Actinomycetota bacterium]
MKLVVVAAVAALALFVLFVGIDNAGASGYVQSCPSPSAYTDPAAVVAAQSCAVQAERLEQIETTSGGAATLTHTDLMVLVGAVLGAGFLPMLVQHIFGVRGL